MERKHIKSDLEELELLYDCVNLYIDITTPYEWKEVQKDVEYGYETRMKKMKELERGIYQKIVKLQKGGANND